MLVTNVVHIYKTLTILWSRIPVVLSNCTLCHKMYWRNSECYITVGGTYHYYIRMQTRAMLTSHASKHNTPANKISFDMVFTLSEVWKHFIRKMHTYKREKRGIILNEEVIFITISNGYMNIKPHWIYSSYKKILVGWIHNYIIYGWETRRCVKFPSISLILVCQFCMLSEYYVTYYYI